MNKLEESQYILQRIDSCNNSNNVKEKLKKGRMEKNSFLEPITSKMCRTLQSVPCKGFTSVSRIAKG